MPVLSSSSSKTLLELARKAIQTYQQTGNHLSCDNPSEDLKQNKGCFVSLKKNGKLRGCVGTFNASMPVYQNVMRMAVAAAFQDTRFSPVTKEELGELQIEISVLGESLKIQSFDEIQIGRDGVLVQLGDKSGTYLPDVAVEQKWNATEFVTYCAREKVGLSPEECAKAEIYRYEVQQLKE